MAARSEGSWWRRLSGFGTVHLPEERLLPDDAARAAWRQIVRRQYRTWYRFGAAVLYVAAGIPLFRFFASRIAASAPFLPPRAADWLGPLMFAVGSAALGSILDWRSRQRMHLLLREHLVSLRIPICLHCGYDLRGQTDPRCPECGHPFDPALLQPPEKGGN